MRLIAFTLLLLLAQLTVAQADTTSYYGEDTIIPQEEFPHYIGINITPLVSSIIGGNNKDIKLSATYKYNLGEKNLRTSLNYVTQSNPVPFDYYQVSNTSDTSYDARFFGSNYRTFDIRFGFEELKGYRFSRLHIGADLILGYGEYNQSYYSRNYQLDSSGTYELNSDIPVFDEGFTNGSYFDVGIDVSFGFDWFMSEHFLFTFQLTPQFNYFILTDSKIEDSNNRLTSPANFPEFKIGLFDVYMTYKF
jgi:hypothetical protein